MAVTGKFWDRVPEIRSIGRLTQTRIKLCRDRDGNDITPFLSDFLENGSIRQPKVKEGDEADDDIQRVGIISDRVLDAESMAAYKREHWYPLYNIAIKGTYVLKGRKGGFKNQQKLI